MSKSAVAVVCNISYSVLYLNLLFMLATVQTLSVTVTWLASALDVIFFYENFLGLW